MKIPSLRIMGKAKVEETLTASVIYSLAKSGK